MKWGQSAWCRDRACFLSLSVHFLFHKLLLPVFPSLLSAISLLDSVRGYWMGDWRKRRRRRRVGTCDRHGWAVSVVMATQKCIYHSTDWDEVTADHSLHFISLPACRPHPPSFLSFFSVSSSPTFPLSSSVLFFSSTHYPFFFSYLLLPWSCCEKQASDSEKFGLFLSFPISSV